MKSEKLLDEILQILHAVKDNDVELQRILNFLHENIVSIKEDEEISLPPQYKQVIESIAGSIDAGFVCFLNPDTLEIEEVPQGLIDDPEGSELLTGVSLDDCDLKYTQWEQCITIEPMCSRESFTIMDQFVRQLRDTTYRNRLIDALHERKPFARFKQIIDNSPYRQDWFEFKNKATQQHVIEVLIEEMGLNAE